MELNFDLKTIEKEQQALWEQSKNKNPSLNTTKTKFLSVAMFPYPSGNLHMGHVRNYTITDAITRYRKMQGFDVLQPFGWDAFGLPAENAALKNHSSAAEWTYNNIQNMKIVLKRLGFDLDWSREVTTCDPEYYRFEQEFFLKMFDRGLAYKQKAFVNWDPVDQTVLANEQIIDGRGWRSGALVERREIEQWFLKITAYAEELLNDLDTLKEWPPQVVTMQRNWIGKSKGVEIQFGINHTNESLTVFTTKPETIFGVSYIALAPEHPFVQKLPKDEKLVNFLKRCKQGSTAEKDLVTVEKIGYDTGLKAINPVNHELVPIWIANFVLMTYGTGAVMAVPAHDERDFAFAKKYRLPIKAVISKSLPASNEPLLTPYTEKGFLFNSGIYNGLSSDDAFEKIVQDLTKQRLAQIKINYRLRDWGISRQRYWGTPIPIIYCPHCGLVKAEDLPVKLPHVTLEKIGSPLKELPTFYQVKCPQCHRPATRETDTFDTFLESSWYLIKYASPTLQKAEIDQWMPVDTYVGGIEHAVLHLLYSRFIFKVLRDLGYLSGQEPIKKLITQGMVLKDGAKMSKSKGNTVEPREIIEQYGADTVRLFMLFISPVEQSLEWSQAGVEGAHRFIKRLYHFILTKKPLLANYSFNKPSQADGNLLQIEQILAEINRDFALYHLNTVVSGAMKLFNFLSTTCPDHLLGYGVSILLRVLMPIIPHITEYLWRQLAWEINFSWPQATPIELPNQKKKLVIQINGKLRDVLEIDPHLTQSELENLVLNLPKINKYLAGKKLQKIIVTPKLINLVITSG